MHSKFQIKNEGKGKSRVSVNTQGHCLCRIRSNERVPESITDQVTKILASDWQTRRGVSYIGRSNNKNSRLITLDGSGHSFPAENFNLHLRCSR